MTKFEQNGSSITGYQKGDSMTPREKQERFRSAIKEYLAWTFAMSVPFLMVIHWVIIGY